MPQDYLLRLIEQAAKVLAAIIGLRQAGRNEEAAVEVDAACRQTVGLDAARIRRMAPENLAALLESSGGLRHARAIMLAELLLQDADLCELDGRPGDALLDHFHAYCLLRDTMHVLTPEEQLVYRTKMDGLAARLAQYGDQPVIAAELARGAEAS